MTTAKGEDLEATLLTALAVLAFFAADYGWNVPLVGDSHRWAALGIGLLGILTCRLGTMEKGSTVILLGVLGAAALVLVVVAIWTASLTALSLLVADVVALWALSTLRHVTSRRAARA